MMKNPRHTNETNAITLDYDDGGSIYTESTGPTAELWQRAISGEFGPVEPYTPPPEPTPEEILAAERAAAESNRQAAYTQEADPLFFKYQRGEATEQEWLDKIEEIRARYPYPEEAEE